MTNQKKIEILQEENARLREELERTRYLSSDQVANYVADYEKANRELFIELQELREHYQKTFQETLELLSEPPFAGQRAKGSSCNTDMNNA